MMMQNPTRRRRQDCNHAVYTLINVVTGDYYIGITVAGQTPKQALKVRMQKHIRRALTENKDWALCKSIRTYGPDAFVMLHIDTIRGRKPAHAYERELIRAHIPALNSH